MGGIHPRVVCLIISLLMINSLFVVNSSASSQGQILIDDSSIVFTDTTAFWGNSTQLNFSVVEQGFGNGNISVLYTHESMSGSSLNSSNSQHSLNLNETLNLTHEINDVPLGYSRLRLNLYGDVGLASSNYSSEIVLTFYRNSPLEIGLGGQNSIVIEGYNNGSETSEIPRDGQSFFVQFPVINSGDVDWEGNISAVFSQNGTTESTNLNVSVPGMQNRVFRVNSTMIWAEGIVNITMTLGNITDANSQNNQISFNMLVEEPVSPILLLNLSHTPAEISLSSQIQWALSVENSVNVSYSGSISCRWSDDTELFTTELTLDGSSSQNLSFTSNAIPSRLTCDLDQTNLSKYSETSVNRSLEFESGLFETASESKPSIMGGPWYEGDEVEFSLLVRNLGSISGSVRLYVVVNDTYFYGDYELLEPNSAGEITLEIPSMEPGNYSLNWGLSSPDSRVSQVFDSQLNFSVLQRQSINLEILELNWEDEGLEVTVSANLDSYRERHVELTFSEYNLQNSDLDVILRLPVYLGSASQIIIVNLGQLDGQAIHVSARGLGWEDDRQWGEYLEYSGRTYGYEISFPDFPNPRNPVAGQQATLAMEVTSTGDLPVDEILYLVAENGTVLASQRVTTSSSQNAVLEFSWPEGESVTLKAYMGGNSENYIQTYDVVIIEETSFQIPWNGVVGGLVASLFVFLVIRVATKERIGGEQNNTAKTPNITRESTGQEKVEVSCPECSQSLRVPADYRGNAKCPACETKFEVSPNQSPKIDDVDEEIEEVKDNIKSDKKEVACPDCDQRLKIPSSYEGSAKCPACNCVFSCKI